MGDKSKGKGAMRVASCTVENGVKLWKAIEEKLGGA
jgi:hypothetical protein